MLVDDIARHVFLPEGKASGHSCRGTAASVGSLGAVGACTGTWVAVQLRSSTNLLSTRSQTPSSNMVIECVNSHSMWEVSCRINGEDCGLLLVRLGGSGGLWSQAKEAADPPMMCLRRTTLNLNSTIHSTLFTVVRTCDYHPNIMPTMLTK